jgi:hypothetical protein
LDGHWVLYHLLPEGAAEVFDQIRPLGIFLLYGLMLLGILRVVFTPVIWMVTNIRPVTELYLLVH